MGIFILFSSHLLGKNDLGLWNISSLLILNTPTMDDSIVFPFFDSLSPQVALPIGLTFFT